MKQDLADAVNYENGSGYIQDFQVTCLSMYIPRNFLASKLLLEFVVVSLKVQY